MTLPPAFDRLGQRVTYTLLHTVIWASPDPSPTEHYKKFLLQNIHMKYVSVISMSMRTPLWLELFEQQLYSMKEVLLWPIKCKMKWSQMLKFSFGLENSKLHVTRKMFLFFFLSYFLFSITAGVWKNCQLHETRNKILLIEKVTIF